LVGAHTTTPTDFVVKFMKGANGFGEAQVFDGGDNQIACPGAIASFDLVSGVYMATVPATCVGSPSQFEWKATRQVDSAIDDAPDTGIAAAVTDAKMTGYWAIGSDGKVYPFGDAPKLGEPVSPSLSVIDIEAAPHGIGYWTLDDKGIITAFGPLLHDSIAAADLKGGEKAVSISSTPTGAGYWIFTNQGRVFAFGDAAKDLGDVSALKLNGEILDSAATPSGHGYYMVGSDGGVFALGDAAGKYKGSMGGKPLNAPVQSIVPDPDNTGYWLVASDGGVFAFDALFKGSMGDKKLNKPMTGMVPYTNAYLMVAEDGGIFNFSDQPFSGSLGDKPPAHAIVSITTLS
jgi:hypothetical protein